MRKIRRYKLTDRYRLTTNKWITSITFYTSANWNVVMNSTIGIQTTRTWTGILTSLTNTSLIARTIGRNNAFGTTIWWCTNVINHTRTGWITVDVATLRIRSAR